MKRREVYGETEVRYEKRGIRYYMVLVASYIEFADLLFASLWSVLEFWRGSL